MTIRPLKDFVRQVTQLAEANLSEDQMLNSARPLLADLLRHDDWLPDAYAAPNANRYQQYLLHCDPLERFSLVSFVWGPGQETPIHDHQVWGLIGVLRGSETSQRYEFHEGVLHLAGSQDNLEAGAIDMVSPTIGDIHRVRNGSKSQSAVSIHLYGGNIGAVDRHTFDTNGTAKNFRSAYSLETMPNIWS